MFCGSPEADAPPVSESSGPELWEKMSGWKSPAPRAAPEPEGGENRVCCQREVGVGFCFPPFVIKENITE